MQLNTNTLDTNKLYIAHSINKFWDKSWNRDLKENILEQAKSSLIDYFYNTSYVTISDLIRKAEYCSEQRPTQISFSEKCRFNKNIYSWVLWSTQIEHLSHISYNYSFGLVKEENSVEPNEENSYIAAIAINHSDFQKSASEAVIDIYKTIADFLFQNQGFRYSIWVEQRKTKNPLVTNMLICFAETDLDPLKAVPA